MKGIYIATSDEQVLATYEVMAHLREHIARSEYLGLVRSQKADGGFELAYLLNEQERITCVAGFRFCRSLGWGKYLYVDDLVTTPDDRSAGYGASMLDWLTAYARDHGCASVRLDSALERRRAHQFYMRMGMDIHCFHFRKNL
jgi:GNAT superfamily N-acetyltransferase